MPFVLRLVIALPAARVAEMLAEFQKAASRAARGRAETRPTGAR
jgi:hypothetical protein